MMTVSSMKAAQKRNSPRVARNHGMGRAYVARLLPGPRGSLDRTFLPHRKNTSETQVVFDVTHRPGDIYEIRRWQWDAHRLTFTGGTSWIGFDERNEPFVLTREEAVASVHAMAIGADVGAATSTDPRHPRPQRMIPPDLRFA